MKLGCHVSNSGSEMLLGSVNEAVSYDANCFMVYLGAPQNSYRKEAKDMNIDLFLEACKKHNIALEDVIVHAPYILNLAQTDEVKRKFAVDFLVSEIQTMDLMQTKYMVLHPGNTLDFGLEVGIENIIRSLKEILARTPKSQVVICLETMAGKGSECCYMFEHLRTIMDAVASNRIQVCLDTCHTSDSGYDWVNDYENIIRELHDIIGLEHIKVIHLNDTKNPKGARKDRHENIGFGYLGFETLAKVAHDERFKDIPKILETPYIENDGGKKEFPPYKEEIEMLKKNVFNPSLKEDILKKSIQ